MKPLQPPDSHYISAAYGWLGLGRPVEANDELERISPENLAHPDVMEVLWHLHARARNWNICLDIARAILKLDSERSSGWIHRSFALFELNRPQDAFDELCPVAERFPTLWRIPYTLACCCAQLGKFAECQTWLNKAMAIDKSAVKPIAMTDPNLMPLWLSLRKKDDDQGSAELATSVKHTPTLASSHRHF
jgi:predicted Zn-dependent protease